MINYSKTIEKDILERNDADIIVLKQYENKYTTLIFKNFTPEEGYEYMALYKRLGDSDVYELPLVGNTLPLDTYLTNTTGQYKMQIVAMGSENKVVPFAWFQIKVEAGVYDPEAETPELPEPIKSKYKELLAVLEDLEEKIATDYYRGPKGEKGDRGEKGEKGDKGAKGDKGDAYIITERDYEAIADIATERAESKFNQYYDGKVEAFDTNATNKTNAFNTNATAKTTEFDTHATEKADEEIARINADDIVARIDEKADKSDTYTKEEVDEKVAQATPTDYEQVKEDIALLKWKTLNLATEVVDSQEAYSKSVLANVYENALLNKLGGKTEVANQLVQSRYNLSGGGLTFVSENYVFNANGVSTSKTSEVSLRIPNKTNHKYLLRTKYIDGTSENGALYFSTQSFGEVSIGNSRIFTNTSANEYWYYTFRTREIGVKLTNYKFIVSIVDLTQRFGAGNEPTSVDDIRIKLLDKELEANPEYNEGSLVSANVESIITDKETKPISAIISKYFPNGLHSTIDDYDMFDLEKGVAIQNVIKAKFEDFTFSKQLYGTETHYRYVTRVDGMFMPSVFEDRGNFVCDRFEFGTTPTGYLGEDMTMTAYTNSTVLYLYSAKYDNGDATSNAFKEEYRNVEFTYKLATPIETPIEQADLEYLEALKVESNGTITFEQLSTYIQIPNEESYLKRVE